MASETVNAILEAEKKANEAYLAACEKAEQIVAQAKAQAQQDKLTAQESAGERAKAKLAAAEKKAGEISAAAVKESQADCADIIALGKSRRKETTKAILKTIIPV